MSDYQELIEAGEQFSSAVRRFDPIHVYVPRNDYEQICVTLSSFVTALKTVIAERDALKEDLKLQKLANYDTGENYKNEIADLRKSRRQLAQAIVDAQWEGWPYESECRCPFCTQFRYMDHAPDCIVRVAEKILEE